MKRPRQKRDPLKATKVNIDDPFHAVWDALDGVIEAWESLPGGQNHSPRAIERWLADEMAPAINRGRKVMGRKAPNE